MSEIWQEYLQQVLLNAIPIVVPLLIAWLVKVCVNIWQMIKSQHPQVAWELEQAAKFAVAAAEQVGLSGALSEFADSKLDYALETAQKYLASRGIKNIDLSLLRAAIEAAVINAHFPSSQTEKTALAIDEQG